jgi:hypothetical protein
LKKCLREIKRGSISIYVSESEPQNKMTTQEQLSKLTTSLAEEIKGGVLPSTIKARLINNGASEELATKVTRIAELVTK